MQWWHPPSWPRWRCSSCRCLQNDKCGGHWLLPFTGQHIVPLLRIQIKQPVPFKLPHVHQLLTSLSPVHSCFGETSTLTSHVFLHSGVDYGAWQFRTAKGAPGLQCNLGIIGIDAHKAYWWQFVLHGTGIVARTCARLNRELALDPACQRHMYMQSSHMCGSNSLSMHMHIVIRCYRGHSVDWSF